jgi:predicted HTH transcriptional regulator
MPRNRELMRVFRDIDLVEQIGSGMSRILKVYDRSIFELTPSFTIVTFPFAEDFITPNGKINDNADGRIRSIPELLKSDPTATIPKMAEQMGESQRTISRKLQEYKRQGLIWREGARKNGRWVVK